MRKTPSKGPDYGPEKFLRKVAASRESSFPARIEASFDAAALRGNYEAIRTQVPGQAMLPMVKANAYGHGAVWVARQLLDLPNLYGLGVATLEEGEELRTALGPKARRIRILVCSGAGPWSEAKGQYCERYGLIPVIGSDPDWQAFLKGGWPERLRYELKFNTGMNRLGIGAGLAASVAKALRRKDSSWHPEGILTHLAISEDPACRTTRQQVERFHALKAELAPAFPAAQFHLANSGGIWNHKALGLARFTDAVRPGLSLYGVPPWKGAPARGLVPVMTIRATVIAIHALKPGEGLGYGIRYKVPRHAPAPVQVAILSAGYADGIHRALSGTEEKQGGYGWLKGRETRFLGRVSMDLSAVRATAGTKPGDRVEIVGPNIDPWAQAEAAGTIPYELLTSVSPRVQRIYD